MLTDENGEINTRRYWNLSFHKNGNIPSVKDAAIELRELLSDAVRMRLVSDVPLGVLLSGGIDSSTVAAFATQHATDKVKTFSIAFDESSFDESEYARLVAEHLGTEHFEERLSVDKAADLISEIGHWLDEPLSDGSLIPTYLLSRFVRRHVTVALGGDGGDELFAGYPMYYGLKMASVYARIPRFLRRGIIEPVVNILPVSTKNLSFDYKAKRFVAASHLDPVARHHTWFGSFPAEQHSRLLTSDVLNASRGEIYDGATNLLDMIDGNEIEKIQYLDMNFYLAEDILSKVDRAAMSVSLETRAPFLDPRVAKFAASIPVGYKLRGRKGKYILRKAVENLLPAAVLQRSKKGFGIPIAQWLKTRLNPLLHELLEPKRLQNQGLFNADFVLKMIREHEIGAASYHKELWTLLVFQLWWDNFR